MKIYHELTINNGYVLDPFSESEEWIYRRSTSNYFWSNYGLTLQEVYNICHGKSRFFVHTCEYPTCDNPTYFHSLSRGYDKSCCTSHARLLQYINNPELRDVVDDNLNNVISQAQGRRTHLSLMQVILMINAYFMLAIIQ